MCFVLLFKCCWVFFLFFFFQAEDGIRDRDVTGVQTCALPISRVRLVSRSGEREVLLSDLYNNDGIDYIKRKPDEILAEVLLDSLHGWKSTYWKLRRRGSFDFPVLSVAAAVRLSRNNTVEDARIIVGSAACRPLAA